MRAERMDTPSLKVLVLGQDAGVIDAVTKVVARAYPAGDMAVLSVPLGSPPPLPGPGASPDGQSIRAALLAAGTEAWARESLARMALRQFDVPVLVVVPGPSVALVEFALERGAAGVLDARGLTAGLLEARIHEALRRHAKRLRRRRAYAALRSSANSLRRVIERNADAIVVVNRDGLVRFMNPAAEALFARPARELLGAELGLPLPAGETTEVDIVRPGGQTVAAEMRVVQTQWEGEAVFLASLRDVTERKRGELARITLAREQAARAEAEAAERRASFLAEASRLLAASLDYQATLDRAARLAVPELADACVIDLEDGETIRTVVVAHVDPAGAEVIRQLRERYPSPREWNGGTRGVIAGGRPEWIEHVTDDDLRRRARDDGHLDLLKRLGATSLLCVPLVAREKAFGALTLLATTAGRRLTRRDVALAEELAKRAATAVENARLFQDSRHANAAKDRFLAVLSHELRTPLTPVLLSLSLLEQQPLPPAVAAELEVVRRNVNLEARLIDDLLDLTRIVHDKLRLDAQPVDLAQVVRAAVDICRSAADAKGIAMEVAVPSHPVVVSGDAARLQQVLWNLIRNAIKFTPDNGRVTVELTVSDGQARACVRDSGIGIAPDALAKVFNAFEQVERRVTDSYGGLGLGLTIAKALVEMHHGQIRLESDGPGRGTCVTVTLPAAVTMPAPGPRGAGAAPAASSPPPPPAARHVPPARVLLVEDHPDTRVLMRRLLASYGHEVVAAGTVEEARRRMAEGAARFDILVSDISLPDGSGLELMPEFRTRHRGRGIAISGFGMDHDVRRSRDAGFTAHLTKPVDMVDLLRNIEAALSAAKDAGPGAG